MEERVHVGSLSIDPLTMQEVVRRIREIALTKGKKARMIATANAQFVQIARSNRRFRGILRDAEIVVADGMSIVAASRLLGRPLPERIAGIDLVVEICREAANMRLSVYLPWRKAVRGKESGRQPARQVCRAQGGRHRLPAGWIRERSFRVGCRSPAHLASGSRHFVRRAGRAEAGVLDGAAP